MILAVSGGCYPDWPEHAGTAEVRGEIELDGLPLHGAKVVFVPQTLRNDAGRLMRFAYGRTGADGKFDLAYADGSKFLQAGRYSLVISRTAGENLQPADLQAWQSATFPTGLARMELFHDPCESLPADFHRTTELVYELQASPSIVRPKFELQRLDPRLKNR